MALSLPQEEISRYLAEEGGKAMEEIDMEEQKRLCCELGVEAYIKMIFEHVKQVRCI